MNTTRPTEEPFRLGKTADAMGSTYSIVLYGYDAPRMDAAVNAAFDELQRLDEKLSNYRPESEWSEVNRKAAQRPVKVSPELFRLLSTCLEYSRRSQGAFDISAGPLVREWGFFKDTGRLPDEGEIAAALAAVGYHHLLLDPTVQTVRFDRSGMEIDPGGVGKGYAVDCMVDNLQQRGFDTALVAASGSSISGLGAPPTEPLGWPVDIRDPVNPRKLLAEVFLKDRSMSTSGISEKSFRTEGRVYSHIIDPRTGYPAQGTLSVSVIAPRALDSEAWTKACFVNGREWAVRHKPAGFRVFFCEDRPEQPCRWLE